MLAKIIICDENLYGHCILVVVVSADMLGDWYVATPLMHLDGVKLGTWDNDRVAYHVVATRASAAPVGQHRQRDLSSEDTTGVAVGLCAFIVGVPPAIVAVMKLKRRYWTRGGK